MEVLIGRQAGLEDAFDGLQALFGCRFEGDADFFGFQADEDLVIAQLGRGEEGAFDDKGVFPVVVVNQGLGDEGGLGELEAGSAEAEDGQEEGVRERRLRQAATETVAEAVEKAPDSGGR